MQSGIRQFNATKIGVISGCLLLFGIIFCAILIPKFFKHMVKGVSIFFVIYCGDIVT